MIDPFNNLLVWFFKKLQFIFIPAIVIIHYFAFLFYSGFRPKTYVQKCSMAHPVIFIAIALYHPVISRYIANRWIVSKGCL